MKVKNLIEMLQKCDPEAVVVLETWQDNTARVVEQWQDKEEDFESLVYIADDMEAVGYELEEDGYERTKHLED